MTDSPSPHIYQMYMFCGDSHLRQFDGYSGMDIFSLTSFPGATMKGLAATSRGKIGHRKAILALASVPTPKILFLMFGNVDLDVTWFRNSILEGGVDEEEFFRERLDALREFVKDCQRAAEGIVRRICVILPQLPTTDDSHFTLMTAEMAHLEEHQLIELTATQDCSHLARCHRTARFNEYISQGLPSDSGLSVYRIDDQMADETGLILPTFLRDGPPDVHASETTLPLWWDQLKHEMPAYVVSDEMSRQALGQPSEILQDLDG
jgi:hypothetical protein